MSDTRNDDGDYAVGYGKPPKHSRWKKGQSGNPRGRPKGARGLKTDLHDELVATMEIQINGKRVSGSKQRLMLKTLTARAAMGDVRATNMLITLMLQVFGPEDRGGDHKRLSPQDQQILDQLLARQPGVHAEPVSAASSSDVAFPDVAPPDVASPDASPSNKETDND